MKTLHFFIAVSLATFVTIVLIIIFFPNSLGTDKCIVSVGGVRFDVTVFRQIHSGGDIFVCGTDMTRVFYEEHNGKTLEQMQEYKL